MTKGGVLISAGHSTTDSGAPAIFGKETEANLAQGLRDAVADALIVLGVQAVEDETAICANLPLVDAIKLVSGKALAVEIHFNAAASPTATGVEAISLPDKKITSQKLSAAVSACLGLKLRGEAGWIDQSKSARGKLGFVNAGGIILEVCFISSKSDLNSYFERKSLLARVLAGVIAKEL